VFSTLSAGREKYGLANNQAEIRADDEVMKLTEVSEQMLPAIDGLFCYDRPHRRIDNLI
jgi:hypothetical protein